MDINSYKMYIIINKTKKATVTINGSFPNLDDILNKGHDIIVISLYSNTIKIPVVNICNGIKEWAWKSYSLYDININELVI
jgi:hypothetical protein